MSELPIDDNTAVAKLCQEVAAAYARYPQPPAPVQVAASPTGCLVTCGDLRMRLFLVAGKSPARHLEAELNWWRGARRYDRPELMATCRRDRRTGDWIICVGTHEYAYPEGLQVFVEDVLKRVEP